MNQSLRLFDTISHPKVNADGGYKVASQKSPVFEAHQQARLPHRGVAQQHHLKEKKKKKKEFKNPTNQI